MSHAITIRENGFAEMAFTGSRDAIWHGLGQEVPETASIDEWKKLAGMDWNIKSTPVLYRSADGEVRPFGNEKNVLCRSDNQRPLSIVSDKFHVVQPEQVLEFFRDLTSLHGMKMSTAGTLFEGRKFWGLAETQNDAFNVTSGDKIKANLLLMTSVDGSSPTIARFVSTRVVCNNTLTVALGEGHKNGELVRVTHRSHFDANKIKLDLGILDKGWYEFQEKMKRLANLKMSEQDIKNFYASEFKLAEEEEKNKAKKNPNFAVKRMVEKLTHLAMYGSGSDLARGTGLAALNGVTEFFTHGTGRANASAQFASSYIGDGDQIKQKVFNNLVALAA